jgi:hypothetical protein
MKKTKRRKNKKKRKTKNKLRVTYKGNRTNRRID